MKKLMNWLKNEESGQGMVEYALIIALIAIVVIGAVRLLGTTVEDKFDEIEGELSSTTP